MILLPKPGSTNSYILFHVPVKVGFNPFVAYFDKLLTTQIDLKNDTFFVSNKNHEVLNDSIHADFLHAVRHANGRDWWVVLSKANTNLFFIILVAPQGLAVKTQSIGQVAGDQAGGELVFSPDGSRLARFNTRDNLQLFDFDRCSGTLSNPLFLPEYDDADQNIFAGLAFSADGRFLYTSEIQRIAQYDLLAPDIATSRTVLAEREDTPECTLGQYFGLLELAPDGTIFCRPLNGQKCMHRILRPEKPGLECDFRRYYIQLENNYNYANLPHFPNFRLGPIDGTPCDTLGLDNRPLAGWRHDPTGGLAVDFTSVSWYEPKTWFWDFGDGTTSTERNPAHTFPHPGLWNVCLTVSNAYGQNTKCKTIWVGTSATSEPGQQHFAVFPNPTSGLISWNSHSVLSVKVFDTLGKLQLEKSGAMKNLDLSGLNNGIYFLNFSFDDGSMARKSVLRW